MYILTGLNIQQGMCTIFDTSDKAVDNVSLVKTAELVRDRNTRIYGIVSLSKTRLAGQGVQSIPKLGIGINILEAKQALATYYMDLGVSKEMAYKKAGLQV